MVLVNGTFRFCFEWICEMYSTMSDGTIWWFSWMLCATVCIYCSLMLFVLVVMTLPGDDTNTVYDHVSIDPFCSWVDRWNRSANIAHDRPPFLVGRIRPFFISYVETNKGYTTPLINPVYAPCRKSQSLLKYQKIRRRICAGLSWIATQNIYAKVSLEK